MGKSLRGRPKSDVKTLSRPRGKTVDVAASQIPLQTDSLTGQVLTPQSIHLMRTAIRVVKEALPDTDPKLIGGFFADLLDLWETGQKLDKELLRLKELRFPQDREQLRNFFIWISAIQIDLASYWIGQIKNDLPKLIRELNRLENKPRLNKPKQAPAKKPSVKKRKVAKRWPVVRDSAI